MTPSTLADSNIARFRSQRRERSKIEAIRGSDLCTPTGGDSSSRSLDETFFIAFFSRYFFPPSSFPPILSAAREKEMRRLAISHGRCRRERSTSGGEASRVNGTSWNEITRILIVRRVDYIIVRAARTIGR